MASPARTDRFILGASALLTVAAFVVGGSASAALLLLAMVGLITSVLRHRAEHAASMADGTVNLGTSVGSDGHAHHHHGFDGGWGGGGDGGGGGHGGGG